MRWPSLRDPARLHCAIYEQPRPPPRPRTRGSAPKASSDDDAQAQILSAIQIGLVGWKNLADYDPARLPDLLTDLELWELVGLLLEKTRLAELDRKNSGSPSDSGSAASVPTAAEPKTAATDPAPPSL